MYSTIISDMTWSYSRISAFNSCPYKFFLTYIKPCEKEPMFFSTYGSFMHELLASYYKEQKTKQELINSYLIGFRSHVLGRAPDQKIFGNYFKQGLSCLKELPAIEGKTLGIEREVSFQVGNFQFIGYIDRLYEDRGIIVQDHKSRALKPRSTRGRYTKSDEELDQYLTQLYLYSVPVTQIYGDFPSQLILNCYRTGVVIREPFSVLAFEDAKDWAVRSIESITNTEDFVPNMDYYYCNYICDVHDSCEYYHMNFQTRNKF